MLADKTYIEANIDTFARFKRTSRLNEIMKARHQILAKLIRTAKINISIIDQLKGKNFKRLWADYRSDLKILKRRLFQKKKRRKDMTKMR